MTDLFSHRGVIAAALTPWNDRGDLDLLAFETEIDWLAAQKPLAIGVAAVEVQEYHLLDEDQRVDLVRRAVDRVGNVPVIAGVSSPLAGRSVELAKEWPTAALPRRLLCPPLNHGQLHPQPKSSFDGSPRSRTRVLCP